MNFTTRDILKHGSPAMKRAVLAARGKHLGPEAPKRAPAHVTGKMNDTERRYAVERLDLLKMGGEILAYDFERLTLRLDKPEEARATTYTPDFTVLHPGLVLSFDEIKGEYIRPTGWLKFKWACAQYPCFWFRMWQWKDGVWTCIRESKPRTARAAGVTAPLGLVLR